MEILNVTIANDENTMETLDVEIVKPQPKKAFRRYRSMLRLMDTIHNDIADKLNEKRAANKSGFFREEDDYIPETKHNDHYSLMMLVRSQSNPIATLP